jgi:hypothetical protein
VVAWPGVSPLKKGYIGRTTRLQPKFPQSGSLLEVEVNEPTPDWQLERTCKGKYLGPGHNDDLDAGMRLLGD